MEYRKDIEGLRAIAVCVVLLYHFGVAGFDGGFIGVDVFFVISGYLITSLLLHERERHGRVSFSAFYARRARRLLPISATVLVATAIAGAVVLPATRLTDLGADVRWSAGFAANVLLARRGADYLTSDLPPSPLQHYWSLAVEEQFYVVWPLLIALVTLGVAVGRSTALRRRVAVTMGALIAASFTASVVLTTSQPSWAYYGLHTRAWELGVGALAAALTPAIVKRAPRVRAVVGWLGLGAVVVAAITYGKVAFPGYAAALPVVGTAALLLSGPVNPGSPAAALGIRPLVYLGTRSYSLYLWHWPALILAEASLERRLSGLESAIAAVAVVVVADLGFRLIEQPIRSSQHLIRRRPLSLTIGAGLVATGLLAGSAVAAYQPDLSTGVVADAPEPLATTTTTALSSTGASAASGSTTSTTSTTAVPTPPARIDTSAEPPLEAVVAALANNVLPDNIRPSLRSAGGDRPILYDNGCHRFLKSTVNEQCVFGDSQGSVTIALWGDSHMVQWYNALERIALDNHWRIVPVTAGGCGFLDIPIYNESNDADLKNCGPWRDAARQYMRDQQVDIVFVGQAFALKDARNRRQISAQQWREQLPPVLQSLRADGIEPIVVADAANPKEVVPNCLAQHRNDVELCEARIDDAHTSSVLAALREVTSHENAGLIDPTRWLCSEQRCPVVIGDILVYRDGHHLTTTVVLWLMPLVERLIVPFVEDLAAYREVSGVAPTAPSTDASPDSTSP